MKTKFRIKAESQGWTLKALGERWGVKPRQMANISRAPKQRHWDMLRGAIDEEVLTMIEALVKKTQ